MSIVAGRAPALAYRNAVIDGIRGLLREGDVKSAIDFGAGDGFVASEMRRLLACEDITALDVKIRQKLFHPVSVFDGTRIPCKSASSELVYAIDVLHHTKNPIHCIDEMMRCTSRYLMLKDHTYRTKLDYAVLSVLDELGNRRFGIPSVYNYQYGYDWIDYIESKGFERVRLIHPFDVEGRFWGAYTNRLQYLGLWKFRG